MRNSIAFLSAIAFVFSMTSCEDEVNDLLEEVKTTPTYEQSMNIDLPDTTKPGENQTLYTGHYRIIDLEGQGAPEELNGDISNATKITIEELFLRMESVQAVTDNHMPEMSGRVIFFRADNFDENNLPADDISGSELPEGVFGEDLIGSIETNSSDFKQGDRWTYEDGEGTFYLDIDKEDILNNVVSAISSNGKVGVALYMKYTGETPFTAEATLGMTAGLTIQI